MRKFQRRALFGGGLLAASLLLGGMGEAIAEGLDGAGIAAEDSAAAWATKPGATGLPRRLSAMVGASGAMDGAAMMGPGGMMGAAGAGLPGSLGMASGMRNGVAAPVRTSSVR